MVDRKTIIIIALSIVLIAMVCIFGYALLFNQNHFERVNISETCSLEVPVGKGINGVYVNDTSIYQVTNGEGVNIMCYNSKNNDLASSFGFAVVKEMAVGSRFTEDAVYQATINGSTVWSIATGNDDTHDNILISTPDKDLTLKIYESIKYNNGSMNVSKNNTSNTPTVSKNTNNTHIVGYDQDGNPVYEGQEPWVWVDSNGMKHWSPEHQQASRDAQTGQGSMNPSEEVQQPESGGSSDGGQSQVSGGGSSSEGSVVTTTAG